MFFSISYIHVYSFIYVFAWVCMCVLCMYVFKISFENLKIYLFILFFFSWLFIIKLISRLFLEGDTTIGCGIFMAGSSFRVE